MGHGGYRKGAGRPKGSGRFGETTKAIRLPASVLKSVDRLLNSETYQLPLYTSKVAAGLPTPAEDHIETHIDLHEYLIKEPQQTFLVRAKGESMLGAGIHDNDILVVDRTIPPTDGKIVIAAVNGELTVKRLHKNQQGQLFLVPENDAFPILELTDEHAVHIWGVVTSVIHKL